MRSLKQIKAGQFLQARSFGFTLVELLVVMSIIALLLTVGLSFYGNAQRASRDAKRRADLDAIKKSIEIYRTERNTYIPSTVFPCNVAAGNGDYPFSHAVYGTQGTAGPACVTSIRRGFEAYFVNNTIPEDPFCSTTDNTCSNSWDNYDYAVAGDGASFILYARLENAPTTPCSGPGWAVNHNYCVRSQQ